MILRLQKDQNYSYQYLVENKRFLSGPVFKNLETGVLDRDAKTPKWSINLVLGINIDLASRCINILNWPLYILGSIRIIRGLEASERLRITVLEPDRSFRRRAFLF